MEGRTPEGSSRSGSTQYLSSCTPLLPEELLNAFVMEFDCAGVVGLGIGGSQIRGDATPYSDIDLLCFYSDIMIPPLKTYCHRQGRLVSIANRTVASVRRDFTRPTAAIYAVPMMRDLLILLDKNGMVGELQQEAHNFTWELVREAAIIDAHSILMECTENVYKLLGIMSRDDEIGFASTMMTFPLQLTRAVALQRGIFITTDNLYYRQVRNAVGPNSSWTQAHIRAVSFDPPPLRASAICWHGNSLLALYRETTHLLVHDMRDTHRAVIENTLRSIDTSGLMLAGL